MPHRNTIRRFVEESSYHCYNRGVEQRLIFLDSQDYGVFLQRLKMMLDDPRKLRKEFKSRELIKSFYGDIDLLAYCLMGNHFHLLLHQQSEHGVSDFMRTLSTSYTMYFNKRYDRVGPLFQGKYKARLIDDDSYRLHISRYIHLNPLHAKSGYERYEYSSYQFLANPNKTPSWVKSSKLLEDFSREFKAYDQFVADYANPDKFEQLSEEYELI